MKRIIEEGRTTSRPRATAIALAWSVTAALLAGCASGRGDSRPPRTHALAAGYVASCSVSDECRVQYIDEEGVLRARDVVGEWKLDLGVDPGTRLWIRASAGGCPPRPLRVEIWIDGRQVSGDLERAAHATRCDWLLAETEFRVP